jgi:photosystem II stability/assembly factor-like uncharacterized protein
MLRMRFATMLLVIGAVAAALPAAQPPSSTTPPPGSGVTARLRGISVVSDTVAWASGTDGTVIRTRDGGQTWTRLTVDGAARRDFRDVDAVSEREAFVLSIGPGDASRIYKTSDAGATWVLQFTNADPKAFFDAMAFWDARRGLAVSDSVDGAFVILATSDGGSTWSAHPADRLPPALPGEGAFAASGTNVAVHGTQHAWFATGAGRVLRTSDGGASWTIAATPLAALACVGGHLLGRVPRRRGVVVGGDYRQERAVSDNAAVTSDGGQTWTLRRGLGGYRSAVAYVPGRSVPTLIAAGPTGADISTDEGRAWRPLSEHGFHAIGVSPSGRIALGVGERGLVAPIVVALDSRVLLKLGHIFLHHFSCLTLALPRLEGTDRAKTHEERCDPPSRSAGTGVPGGEHVGFALGRKARAQRGLTLRRLPVVIRQRRLRRVGQRPERQARRDRLAAVHPRPAGAVAPRRHPHGKLRIRPHLPLEQEVGIDPRVPRVAAGHGLDAIHHPRHRQPRPRPDAVVHARRPLLAQAHHELRHVARVDERHRIVGRPGRQHLAATLDPHRPVREPIRQVARTHDQPGTHHERAVAERRARPSRTAPSAARTGCRRSSHPDRRARAVDRLP